MITIAPELRDLPHYQLADLLELQGELKDLTERNAAKLRRSITKHGIFVPFFVWSAPDGNTYILDGHQRKRTLVNDGHGALPVPCVLVHADTLPEAKEKLLVISSQYGRITQEGFDEFTFDLPDIGEMVHFDALSFEFGQDEEQAQQGDAEPQIDRAAELREKWQTERGQLWAIGEHRLLCGDSTVRADVERVMGGERARLVATSPPYNNQREYEIGDFDWQKMARGFSDNVFSVLGTPGDFLCNLGLEYYQGKLNPYWNEWLDYCKVSGRDLYGWYVWDKGSGFPGEWNGRLAPSHEWVFHFSNGRQSANKWIETTGESAKRGSSGKRFRQKDGSLRELTSPDKVGQSHKIPDSIIRINREMARGIHTESHPAVYPVEFASFFVNTWSEKRDAVYDPFAGSGTTLVACQNLSRRGRAIEISPAYCAVILQRMTDAFPGIEIHQLP